MIEKMKKLAILLHTSDRNAALIHLQELGLIHLDIAKETPGEKCARLKILIERHSEIIKELNILNIKKKSGISTWPSHLSNPTDQLQYLEDLFSLRQSFQDALLELQENRRKLLPWGNFNIARLDELTARRVRVRFMLGAARVFDTYEFENITVEEINRTGDQIYFLIFEYNQKPAPLPFQEIQLPRSSLSETEHEIEIIQNHIEEDLNTLRYYINILPELYQTLADLKSQLQYEEARQNLQHHNSQSIDYITGWFPATASARIINYLKKYKLSYQIDDARPDDPVPVKLHNHRAARLFEPITRIFSLPDYFELDPTLFFAPFFTVFFGLCLGDLGYGVVLAVLSLVLRWILPPDFKSLCSLGLILSFSTMASGVLLNSVFGQPLFLISGVTDAVLPVGGELAIFASYNMNGKTIFPAMALSLLLGLIQLLVGMGLQATNAYRRAGPVFALKALAMVTMICGSAIIAVHADFLGLGFNANFEIGPLSIGSALSFLPAIAGYALLALGLFVFFVFNNPDKKLFLRPLLGLWEFYQFITGLLGDFLSYIRLFALGLASGLLGNAFNKIAFMILPQTSDGPVFASGWIVISIFILVLGHSLNLGLAVLGAFVHPLRLTFVEFYKNIQFKGGGLAYTPFQIHKKESNATQSGNTSNAA